MVRDARLLAGVLMLAAALVALAVAGCGAAGGTGRRHAGRLEVRRVAWPVPIPVGRGPAFSPPAHGSAAAHARAISRLRCRARFPARAALAHVELFARGLVVPVPAGIGIAPPLERRGAYVRGGRCSYPVRTTEPTGLLELRPGAPLTLGDLFTIWGQPLSRTRLGAFHAAARAAVRAYLFGRRWRRDPRALPLSPGAVVVLEVGRYVRPHVSYRFPPGR